MSDTPETDAAQHEGLLRTNPIPMQVVTAEFARKLERERDKAREELSLKCQSVTIASGTISDLFKKSERLEKQIEGLNNFANERFDEIQRVRRERDEAREERDILRLDAQREAEHHDRMVGELEKVYKERDEALNAIHTYRCEVEAWELLSEARRERDEAREIAQQLVHIASHCLGWHENANPETITEAIKRWNASTKK